jgi:hypothetical protein
LFRRAPKKIPGKAIRPYKRTAAKAKPADGKMGEIFPGGIFTICPSLAPMMYIAATPIIVIKLDFENHVSLIDLFI